MLNNGVRVLLSFKYISFQEQCQASRQRLGGLALILNTSFTVTNVKFKLKINYEYNFIKVNLYRNDRQNGETNLDLLVF